MPWCSLEFGVSFKNSASVSFKSGTSLPPMLKFAGWQGPKPDWSKVPVEAGRFRMQRDLCFVLKAVEFWASDVNLSRGNLEVWAILLSFTCQDCDKDYLTLKTGSWKASVEGLFFWWVVACALQEDPSLRLVGSVAEATVRLSPTPHPQGPKQFRLKKTHV